MLSFFVGTVLAMAAVVVWVLERTYRHVPPKELKRLARRGDEVAVLLYRAAAFGVNLRAFLWSLWLLLVVLSLLCLAHALGLVWAIFVLLLLLGVGGFVFVPSEELTHTSLWLAKRAAPGLSWLLERLHPLIDALVRFARKHRHLRVHTGLYEKADIVELLQHQKGQPDSRISPSEVELLQHALQFGDTLVAQAMVPKRVVESVAATENIGPVLMSDLHAGGHSRFPVYDGKKDNIVGILYLHDLVGVRQTGKVSDVMKTKLTYVHEDFTLYQALQAFLKTKHHLFLVVNSFEELVGIITIEDVLEQMIGKPIVDEFDRYDDLRAVAMAAAKKEHAQHDEPEIDRPPTPETKEVVE